MREVAMLGLLAFLVTGAIVGMRLLWLARRTGHQPERVLGMALVALCILGYPLVLASRLLETTARVPAELLGLAGNAGVALCAVLVAEFTRRVFYPERAAARAVLLALAALETVLVLGLSVARRRAFASGADAFGVMEAVTPWVLPFLLVLAVVFGWAGLESARYHAVLRRRRALGLAEPELVNRLLLWTVSMLSASGLILGITTLRLAGARITEHPAPMLMSAVAGLTVSIAWYLAFLPPRAYRERLARARG